MPTYDHDGLTFDYRDEGSGTPVVLLHGFPQDASSWDRVAPRLHEAGVRTLAPDQRGYSPGARPVERSAYRIDRLSGDVIALLDAVGVDRAVIVGHDWGGAVAWDLAMRHPDRVAAMVALSTPHPVAMKWAYLHSTQLLRSWYMGAFQVPWFPERSAARVLGQSLRSSGLAPDLADRYAARFSTPESLTGPINWYRAIPFSQGKDMPSVSPFVTVPTTYIWGTQDRFLGRAAAVRTAGFVRAPYRFVEVEASHWLPEECPELVAAEVLAQARHR